MASPYANGTPAGQGAGGGFPYASGTPGGQPAKSKGQGGGFLGALKSAAHFVAQKTDLAAHDIKQIPGGIYDMANTEQHLLRKTIAHPLANPNDPRYGVNAGKWGKHANAIVHGLEQSTVSSVEHPLRDPLQTILTLAPALHGAGAVVERAGAVADAARTVGPKAAAKAAVRSAGAAPRGLKAGRKDVPLIPSRNAGVRQFIQKPYDRVVQKALDKNESGQATGRIGSKLAAHGQKRVGAALDEEARIGQRMRATPGKLLDQAAVKLSKVPGRRREEQAALELTSVQSTPEEAAAYHRAQAAKGVNAKQNLAVARLYDRVGRRGLVHLDESKPAGAKVFINPEHVRLANTDQALTRVQREGDQILEQHGVRSAEALASRRDAPGQIRAGATYEKPTPGKLGKETPGLKRSRQRVVSLQGRIDRAKNADEVAKDQGLGSGIELKGPMRFHARTPQQMQQLKGALAVANEDLGRAEKAAVTRIKPTGIVGGETARPGRGYVSEKISDKKLAGAEVGSVRGPVVGVPQHPVTAKTYTGRALAQGLRPKNVTTAASHHFQQITRFENTTHRINQAIATGSDIRRSPRDVLVRTDKNAKPLESNVRQVLGQEKPTVDTADELASQEGLVAAHQMFLDHLLGRDDEAANSDRYGIGEKAPDGYKWVDKGALGNLTAPPRGPRGRIARTIDNVNSAITAATVYFKVGHTGTRVLTNAATNIIQGSARPTEIGRSYRLWDKLTDEQKAEALAAAGQHGFAALPHEGDSRISRIAGWGANQWAKHADAPFRFNSLAYELRRIGVDTPDKLTKALTDLKSGGDGLPAHEWSRLSAAARRADREAISYDRLNDFEKRYLTRALWFYPWIKGSTLFTVRTVLEHPFKAATLGAAGAHGRQVQEQQLGPVPSYEQGLIALGGGNNPLTTDFSTFSPFATAADVADAVVRPGGVSGFLNPVAGAAGQFAYGLNQYGGSSNQPYLDALQALAASTPEQQIAESVAAERKDQSGKMFPKSPKGTSLRFLLGPATPRAVNKTALAKAAARERSGRR